MGSVSANQALVVHASATITTPIDDLLLDARWLCPLLSRISAICEKTGADMGERLQTDDSNNPTMPDGEML